MQDQVTLPLLPYDGFSVRVTLAPTLLAAVLPLTVITPSVVTSEAVTLPVTGTVTPLPAVLESLLT